MWAGEHCPIEIKGHILRTAFEEAIGDLDEEDQTSGLAIHGKGGSHTRFEMPKPGAPCRRRTSLEGLELNRRTAVLCADGQIAAVLNRQGRLAG